MWNSKGDSNEKAKEKIVKYGTFDYTRFGELEMRCYNLVNARIVSMWELKEVITLDEMIKLYAIYSMNCDIEAQKADEFERSRS